MWYVSLDCWKRFFCCWLFERFIDCGTITSIQLPPHEFVRQIVINLQQNVPEMAVFFTSDSNHFIHRVVEYGTDDDKNEQNRRSEKQMVKADSTKYDTNTHENKYCV